MLTFLAIYKFSVMESKISSRSAVAALLVIAETLLLFCSCSGDSRVEKCSDSEVEALIGFKNGLEDPLDRLSSWTGNYCCQWRGVGCDEATGAVARIDLSNRYGFWNLGGKISPSLLKLTSSLEYIDLSFNSFGGIPVPPFLGQLVHLQYLNLSNSGFGSPIPPSLGNLSRLAYLDLSSEVPSSLAADNMDWFSGMSALRFLGLDSVDFSAVGPNWASFPNSLPHLTELHLQGCGLSGLNPPLSSANFTSLAVLDLSFNPLGSVIPTWVVNMTRLEYLDMSFSGLFGRIPLGLAELPNLQFLILSGNNLSASCSQLLRGSWRKIEVFDLGSNIIHGVIPSSIGDMASLTDFSLFDNNVEGGIPATIGSLCSLVSFDLSGNNLSGSLPETLLGTNRCISSSSLPSLERLTLSNNQLTGLLPDWLGQLKRLVELSLDYNSLQGPIPASLGKLRNLTDLGLAGNELNGTLPVSLGELSEISNFDVSFNRLSGNVLEEHFMKLSKLKILHLSSNSFVLNVSSGWVPSFQVRNLDIGSCQLGPSFPAWLRSQNEVMYLDLSNTSISGPVPGWFWDDISSNLSLLNMSHNRLRGELPNPLRVSPFADIDLSSNLFQGLIPLPSVEIESLDLSDNQFAGHIPPEISKAMPNLIFLSLASNQITGPIPATMGEMLYLQVIDISNNLLIGRIPPSIGNCSLLKALDLKSNYLSGEIPSSLGQLVQLRSLHLSNNSLTGHLPTPFHNLSSLETLDLGYNQLNGGIPSWLSHDFIQLRILILRSNNFSGELPPRLSGLPLLQVLDLAENNFTGRIPPSFGDFKAMMQEEIINRYLFYGFYRGIYYEEGASVSIKGGLREYIKTLSLVTSIDLSGNSISGELPEEITKLTGLLVLNLPRNSISGPIPKSLSNMHQLSSLDLSNNRLSGEIPTSISSSLTFLGYLNLSDNNFSGKIPYSDHMTTFDASSFAGNPGLCGPPLEVECHQEEESGVGDGAVDSGADDDVGFFDGWFYLSLGVGFAAGLLIPCTILLVRKPWSYAYFGFIDGIVDRWIFDAKGRPRLRRKSRSKTLK